MDISKNFIIHFSSNFHIVQYLDKLLSTTRQSYESYSEIEGFTKDTGASQGTISDTNLAFFKRKCWFKDGPKDTDAFKKVPTYFVARIPTLFDDNYGVSGINI